MISPDFNDPPAVFSEDRIFRYVLRRTVSLSPLGPRLGDLPVGPGARTLNFIGLNPSTADEVRDDPTVRRCIGFARSWGYSRLTVTNLFALRCTDPRGLGRTPVDREASIGNHNDWWLMKLASSADLVVAAWSGFAPTRAVEVHRMLADGSELYCLGLTKGGFPRHPLYMPAETRPVPFKLAE